MKRAFVIRSLLISLAALVIAGIVSAFTVQQEYIDGRKAEMREFINLMSATETSSDYAGLAKRMAKIAPDSLRVTYIAPDGTVLGDSDADPATMENHKSHEEVRAAMESGWGKISATQLHLTRICSTLRKSFLMALLFAFPHI